MVDEMSETKLGICDARYEPEGEPCGARAVERFEVACVHEHVKIISSCGFHSPTAGLCLCRECVSLPVAAHNCLIRASAVSS